VEDGEGKCGGFACAGLRLADNVHSGQQDGNGLRLDLGWLGVAKLIYGLHQTWMQV